MIDYIHKVVMLDNSTIEVLTTCPRKTYYANILKCTTSKPQPALRFGSNLHAALAYRHRCEARGLAWTEATQLRILDKLFMAHPCEDEGWRNLGTAQTVLTKYNLQWQADKVEVARTPAGVPMVEVPFACKAGTVGMWTVIATGRIDLVHRRQGRLVVRDHKTTSVVGDGYWMSAEMSAAQRGYCWALWKTLGEAPQSYEINAIITRAPSKTGTQVEFQRREFPVSPEGLTEWHSNFMELAGYMVWLLESQKFPMHTHHCMGKFGACQFYPVCSLPSGQRDTMLRSGDYKENTWSPLYH